MKKWTRYMVSVQGQNCSFSESGWSGYYKRLGLRDDKKLRGEVYGLIQAREHVKELRRHRYNGALIYKNAIFEISRITTIETIVQIVRPK